MARATVQLNFDLISVDELADLKTELIDAVGDYVPAFAGIGYSIQVTDKGNTLLDREEED